MSHLWSQTHLNSFGLFLDIIGVIVIWKCGLPESLDKEGTAAALYISDEPSRAKAKKHNFYFNIGLSSLVLGFAFQLISNFL